MSGFGDPPPLWPQPPVSALRRRRPPSPLFSPPVLIVLFPVLALVLLFFAIPSFVSFSSHIFRPTTVKKSWDSLNVFLVLFAILCGIFARRDEDEAPVAEEEEKSAARLASADKIPETTLRRWFESGDDKMYGYDEPAIRSPGSGTGRLRRSCSSYPDLKQESPWETGDDRFRFFDDFEVSRYSSSSTQFDRVVPLRRWRSAIDDDDIKVIPVDTFVLRTPPSPASPLPPPAAKSPAPPPPPPPPPVRRTYEAVARRSTEGRASDGAKFADNGRAPPAPAPPPPRPPPTPPKVYKYAKIERRKSNAAKEIKTVLASVLSNQRKRKKKQRTRTLYNDAAHQPAPETTSHSAVQPPAPPPPPPPPPPPSSVFHSLFRKSSKSKRIHSVPAPPPPPPPPPPQEPRRRRTPAAAPKPPLPARPAPHQPGSGARSPFVPMPPPPIRVPEFKFVANGDFVRIRSARSSRSGSPELEDAEVPPSPIHEATTADGQDGSGRASGGPGMFCPSPDVNIKADTFIARLKDGWKLEKINSIREKQSVSGPTPPPT